MADTDAITLLIDDHRRVDALFDEYEAAGDAATKERLVRTIMSELSIHAAVEEQFLYPVVREVVPGGAAMADESLEEHQEIKDVLAALERLGVEHPDFVARMRELVDDVRHHVGEEESDLFPQLREAVGEERLVEMGRALAMGKAMAPTHPHPELPNRPPGNLLVGPFAGIADRLRDGLEGMGDQAQWSELVRQGQQAVWDVVRTWTDAAARTAPSMPDLTSVADTSQWRPDDLVERAFDFSNRLLQLQRQFATDLFGAVTGSDAPWERSPAEAVGETPTPEQAASASAPRTASPRAPAKRSAAAKKATAKKATAKSSTAKSSTAEKAAAATSTAATSTARKATGTKATAKKAAAKKSTAKKSTAKKTTAKKATTRPTTTTAKKASPPQASATSGAATSAPAPEQLREETVDELQDRARDAGVEGRSEMKKDELVDALASGEGTVQATAGSSGSSTPDYASMSVIELREAAKRADVPGRTGMNKAQLVRALQQRSS